MNINKYVPRKARLLALCSVGAISVLLAACTSQDQNKEHKKPLNNEFGQAATQSGANACASLFSILGQTTTANSQFAARVMPDKENSNQHGITGVVGQTYGSGDELTKGTGTIFAAPVNGKCEGILVRTLYMKQSCTDISKTQLPKGSERKPDLTQTAVFTTPEGGSVTMIPVDDKSCIVTMSLNLKDK